MNPKITNELQSQMTQGTRDKESAGTKDVAHSGIIGKSRQSDKVTLSKKAIDQAAESSTRKQDNASTVKSPLDAFVKQLQKQIDEVKKEIQQLKQQGTRDEETNERLKEQQQKLQILEAQLSSIKTLIEQSEKNDKS